MDLRGVRQAARDAYPLRQPYQSEVDFFAGNPEVAGYAAPDRRVVLNPVYELNDSMNQSVHANEGIRHYMFDNGVNPPFFVQPHQQRRFESYGNKAYAENQMPAKQTIVARILAGDDSMAPYSPTQQKAARKVAYGLLSGLVD